MSLLLLAVSLLFCLLQTLKKDRKVLMSQQFFLN